MNMLRHPLRFLLLLLATLPWLSSCSSDLPPQQPEEVPWANLSVGLSLPPISVSTRGIADDDDPATWSDWQKAVDGQMLYHVTLFLLDKNGRLVGYRDLYAGSSDLRSSTAAEGENSLSETAAVASFNYLHPLHGDASTSVERLKGERYTMVVVANYSSTTQSGNPYSGLTSLVSQKDQIISDFNADTSSGIAQFTTTYSPFIQYQVEAGDDYVCPQQPQPLVLVKLIDLHPGENEVSGELLRTYSRIRIEVQNNSDTQDLTVQGLSFCDFFAQKKAYLFYNPDNLDGRFIPTAVGSPSVTSTDAISPFTAGQTISKRNGSGATRSQVIFDGYILESKSSTAQTYTYRLQVAYEGASPKQGYELASTTPIGSTSALKSAWDSGITYYAMQNQNNEYRFLINSGSTVGSHDVEISEVVETFKAGDFKHVWELEAYQADSYQFYIKSVVAGNNYIGTPLRNTNISLLATKNPYFTFSENNGKLCMKSSVGNAANSSGDYINVYGGQQEMVAGWSDNDAGSQFYLYPIEKRIIQPAFDADIELKSIDALTAVVSPVTQINRNDLIQVLVTVAYNENSGKFRFEVLPWTQHNEEITYE